MADRSFQTVSTAVDPTAVRQPIDDVDEIVRTTAGQLLEVLARLKSQGYAQLTDVGGVDYLERSPRFDVVYHLTALPTRASGVADVGRPKRARVLCGVDDGAAVPSAVRLWPNADWPEREVFDLFGITFGDHPDLRRIQMPADWEGHPLRKDYPLRGPARDRTPRPPFANKENVGSRVPPTGEVAERLRQEIFERMRGERSGESEATS
ncbi:MAG TPA: NADH-quinone oxidoreductase subunit C [Candidatus Dormibacteraeota bacterium]|nr:NADH-quinone oxidoreductase subunit C [Candidatus Dormibacteraeota bacterium]